MCDDLWGVSQNYEALNSTMIHFQEAFGFGVPEFDRISPGLPCVELLSSEFHHNFLGKSDSK